jgi:hypothetical protein
MRIKEKQYQSARFNLYPSAMCMDAQVPRAQDAQERPFISG